MTLKNRLLLFDSAQDAAGNVAYAANELRAAGQLAVQDISIFRRPFPGTATVRGRIVRSDSRGPVAGAHVGVYSQGYGLTDAVTDATGQFQFVRVPSGFVTVLAEDYAVAPASIAVDFDLRPDEVHDTGDLLLNVQPGVVNVRVEGSVTIEDPLSPGRLSPAPGAQVQITGMPVVVADATGKYAYDAVPQTFGGVQIEAFDAASGRSARMTLPTLQASTPNVVPITITNVSGSGSGTIRLHLEGADGKPVVGYHVFEPGFPRLESAEKGKGVYEFADLNVGRSLSIVAAPSGATDPTYGTQFTSGVGTVSFAGQIAAVTLRLPGQGSIHARIVQQTESGVLVPVAGQLQLTYSVWSDAQQNPVPRSMLASTDGTSDAIFGQVPVGQSVGLETFQSAGHDSTSVVLGFEGALVSKTLTLSTLTRIHGRVVGPDGFTPVAGAAVHLIDGSQDLGILPSGLDGDFDFRNVAPSSSYTITADFTQNAIYRTAQVTGSTPATGGTIDGLTLILLEQGSVEGTIVDSNGKFIPFAKVWLRELSFPNRSLGSPLEPTVADVAGHFRFNNIFAGPVRVTAEDPNNPDLRGDANGAVASEAQVLELPVTIGANGAGSVVITVVDPNNGFAPEPNADVSLFRGATLFDFGTTDATGSVRFDQVPVDSYSAGAYSNRLAKSGTTAAAFTVTRNATVESAGRARFQRRDQRRADRPRGGIETGTGSRRHVARQRVSDAKHDGGRWNVRLQRRQGRNIGTRSTRSTDDPHGSWSRVDQCREPFRGKPAPGARADFHSDCESVPSERFGR